ncbi:MAG: hypothetical protein ABR559_03110 [Gemmatimonadota bacterium]
MKRHWVLVALAAGAVAAAALWSYAERDYRPVFSRLAGELIEVRDSTWVGRGADGKMLTDVTLVSDTGMEVRLRVRAPDTLSGERFPAALLIAGYKQGRAAVSAPSETGNLVFASIDYPYDGPQRPSVWQWAWHLPEMRGAVIRTPAALLLAAQYLYTRDDVDPQRVSIIGVSLGVPFAAAAAATDRRLASAMLLHGGADIRGMAAYAFADTGAPWLVQLKAAAIALLVAPLEPGRYAGAIAPRPTLMVNATEDELMPRSSVVALYQATGRPKQLVWTASSHLGLDNPALIANLMQIALEWMEENNLR